MGSACRTDLYLTKHNNHKRHPYNSFVESINPSHTPLPDNKNTHIRQTSKLLLCTSDKPVPQNSIWQDSIISTDRHQYDFSVQVISPSQWTVLENTQHSQQTDIHRTPLYEGTDNRTDLNVTTHNIHIGQTSIKLLCTSDQHVAQTYTSQHTTLTTDIHPYESTLQGIRR